MAHHNWAHDLAAQGRLEAAAEHYRAALRLNPDAEAHLGLGAVLDAQGKTDEALAHYLAAVQAKPDFAEAHNNLSSLFVKRRDAQQALGYATEAIRLRPNYAQAHYNLGNALMLLGQITNAVANTDRPCASSRIMPKRTTTWHGRCACKAGSTQAIEEYQTALKLKPDASRNTRVPRRRAG